MKIKGLRINPNASILNAAQCYVVKFQKYFFLFFGHISASDENKRFRIGHISVSDEDKKLRIGPNAFILNAAHYVVKFQKYFRFLYISASDENKRLRIGSNPFILNAAQCYVAISQFLMKIKSSE
ncbi:hypothetical protein PUN28_020605 [Cardiocondyla obscurior]|uniref:Uncharacterized protein n=1 Tax=Cardiocondyla obscurior TaxID=286306 RepID=A0AAW2E4R4_9HYME